MVDAMLRPLYPREIDQVAIVQEEEWAPGPVLTSAENLALTGIRFRTLQLVPSDYTDSVISAVDYDG